MVSGRFIITTGRSGSTLLSTMLHKHPAVLSLSEFFAMLYSTQVPAFPVDALDGEAFWEVLTTPRLEVNELMKGCSDGQDYAAQGLEFGSMPPLLMNPLPQFTDDVLGLYEELGDYVRALPHAATSVQYTRVFEWLCERFHRTYWVERSGGSSWFAADLVRCWPEGRFVHLIRDGRDAAYSMSTMDGFRLAALMDEIDDRLGDAEAAPELIAEVAVRANSDEPIPIERFGRMWSRQAIAAQELLSALPAGQFLLLRYEDLVAEPARELARMLEFFDVRHEANESWIERMVPRVQRPESGWLTLPEAERARLEEACGPGMRYLGYEPAVAR